MAWRYVAMGSAGGLAVGIGAVGLMISEAQKRDAARAKKTLDRVDGDTNVRAQQMKHNSHTHRSETNETDGHKTNASHMDSDRPAPNVTRVLAEAFTGTVFPSERDKSSFPNKHDLAQRFVNTHGHHEHTQHSHGDEAEGGPKKSAEDSFTLDEVWGVLLSCTLLIGVMAASNLRTFQLFFGRKGHRYSAEAWERGFDRFMKGRGINFDRDHGPSWQEQERARTQDFSRKMDAYWAEFNERMARMDREHDEYVRRFKEEQKRRAREAGMKHSRSDVEVAHALRVLGIDRVGLDQKKLRAAYLKAAQKWHPDVWPENQRKMAAEKFKEVGKAFETLSATLPEKSLR